MGLSINCHTFVVRSEEKRVNIDKPLVKGDLSLDCNIISGCPFTDKMKYELERQIKNLHKKMPTLC